MENTPIYGAGTLPAKAAEEEAAYLEEKRRAREDAEAKAMKPKSDKALRPGENK